VLPPHQSLVNGMRAVLCIKAQSVSGESLPMRIDLRPPRTLPPESKKPSTVEEVRGPATEMEACISTAVEDLEASRRTSEVAATCAVLMGW
jgi:hypothetical protein